MISESHAINPKILNLHAVLRVVVNVVQVHRKQLVHIFGDVAGAVGESTLTGGCDGSAGIKGLVVFLHIWNV